MFTRLIQFLLAWSICLPLWFSTAIGATQLDFSRGWWVVRQPDATSAPDARQAWLPLDVVESREFRLSNPTEPGQSLWLKKLFPAPPRQENDTHPWVLTVAHRPMIRQAILNDQPLVDLENVLPPHPLASHPNAQNINERLNRWDQPSRFLIQSSQIKAQGNTLFLQIWDHPRQGSLLGRAQLRRATLEDMVILGVDPPVRVKDQDAAVLVVQPRFSLPKLALNLQARFGNEVGTILREYTQTLSLQGPTSARLHLIPESEAETRAYVQLSWAGEILEEYWVRLPSRKSQESTNHVARGTSVVELTQTSMRGDSADLTFKLTYRVQNHSDAPLQATLAPTLHDPSGQVKALPTAEVAIPAQETRQVEITGSWEGLERWSPWHPALYQLTTTLTATSDVKSIINNRLGLRTWSTQGPRLLLDNQVVHLTGLIQTGQGRGMSLDADTWTRQARLLRAKGVTLLREPHLQPLMLEICDELGLFVGATLDLALSQPMEPQLETILTQLDPLTHHPSLLLLDLRITDASYEQATTAQLALVCQQLSQLRLRYPSLLITVDGWGDLESHDPFYNASHLGDPALPAALDKPLILSEGSRLQSPTWPGYGYAWMGDAALKLADHASEDPPALPTRLALQQQREAELLHARERGVAIHWVTDFPWLTWRHLEPWLAAFPTGHATRFWLGEPTPIPVWVGNDSGKAGTATVTLDLFPPGQTPIALSHTVTLPQGESQVMTFELPALMLDSDAEVPVSLRCEVGGIETSRHEARWSFHPRLKLKDNDRLGLAVIDPTGELAAMLEPLGARLLPITSPEQLPLTKVDLVVLSPAVDPALLQGHPQALLTYLRGGGKVLVLIDQHLPAGFEPWTLLDPPSFLPPRHQQTLVHSPDHPWVEGLLPEDFQHWQGTEALYQRSLFPPRRGLYKVVTGMLPDQATLVEQPLGLGRLILCTLDLRPSVVNADPAAARLLLNLLMNARTGRSLIPNKTLVLSPADAPTPRRLREDLGLVADYLSQAPEKVDLYNLILLSDWQDAPMDKNLGPQLRDYVDRSGTLLIQNPSTKFMDWLGQALGFRFEKRTSLPGRVNKKMMDPLLSGISDALLAWSALHAEGFDLPGTAHRELWIPEGGFELTRPAILVTRPLGRGGLIIDHTPWPSTISPSLSAPGSPGSPPSDLLLHYQRALFTNLSADLTGSLMDGPPTLVGLNFQPVALSSAANRSRSDKTKNDDVGFIDQGPESQLTELKSGWRRFRGVPFHILPDQAETDRSILMLRSKDRLTSLPTQSQPIVVGRAASALFFLHTCAWAHSEVGSTGWEYEIHYADSPSTPDPANPSVIKVPVQVGVDVGDWWGPTKVPGAVALHSGQGQNVWVQRWDNPHPQRPIAHIMMRSLLQLEVPILLAVTAGMPAENVLARANLLEAGFTRTVSLDGVMQAQGKLEDWETWVTRRGSIARFSVEPDPMERQPALVIRHQQGPVAAVLQSPPIRLTPGQTAQVQFEYLTPPHASGLMRISTHGSLRLQGLPPTDGPVEQPRSLPGTGGLWRTVTMEVQAMTGEGEWMLQFSPRGSRPFPEMWVRHLWVQAQTAVPR